MSEFGAFAAALAGDRARLRSLAGPDSIVCVAGELSSVFLIRTEPDGSQRGTLAVVRERGGHRGQVPLPHSFRVVDIGHDGERFTLTAADGRTVHGTPEQFTVRPKLIAAEQNPSYERQFEEIFLATHLLPGGRPQPPAPIPAGFRSEETFDGEYYTVAAADQELTLSFDCAGPQTVTELLPHAQALLAEFATLREAATEFLWAWGAEGDESAEQQAHFLGAVQATDLVILHSRDFELHVTDTSGEYCLHGYWYAVQFRSDGTPVTVTVEA